jgi:hypothetical protein
MNRSTMSKAQKKNLLWEEHKVVIHELAQLTFVVLNLNLNPIYIMYTYD